MPRDDRMVTIACEACGQRNYRTNKSRSLIAERIALKKYCRSCARHTLHKETR